MSGRSTAGVAGATKVSESAHDGRTATAALPCSSDIFAVSIDHLKAEVWDVATGQLLWTADHPRILDGVYSPNANKFVAVAYDDKDDIAIKVWDLWTGLEIMSLAANTNYDNFCDLNQTGTKLLTWSYNPDGICVRNMDSGDILFWMSEACRAPCFIGDGEHAIAVLSSGAVRVLDANNGDEVRSIPQGFSENIVRRPVTSLDGSMCAVLATKEFAVWNTNTWNRSFLKKEYIIDEVSFGESGNLVMVCYSKGVDEPKHHAICWRIADGSIVFDVEMNCNYEFVQHSPHRGTFFLCNSRGNICELDANGSVLSCHKGREGVKSISVIHSIILL
jgi:WD40 repeat protein